MRELLPVASDSDVTEPPRWPRSALLLATVLLLACGAAAVGGRPSIKGDVRQRIEKDLEALGDNQGEQVAGALRDFKRLFKGF